MNEDTNNNLATLISIISTLTFWGAMPLICIWAVNTLFRSGIAFSFKTWLAAACLLLATRLVVTWNRKVDVNPSEFLRDLFSEDEEEDDDEELAKWPPPKPASPPRQRKR